MTVTQAIGMTYPGKLWGLILKFGISERIRVRTGVSFIDSLARRFIMYLWNTDIFRT